MFILFFIFQSIFAQEASVFEVRKNLPLAEGQEVFHDYYVSAGSNDGFKEKMLVTVKRNMPFKDTNLSKVEEDLIVDIATLELIHVQKTFSVARLKEIKKSLALEYNTVMIGDRIPLNSARMPASTKKALVSGNTKKVSKQKPAKQVSGQVKKRAKQVIEANLSKKVQQPDVNISGEISLSK